MLAKSRVIAGVLLTVGVLPLSGCLSAVKHGFYEVRGAKGAIQFVERLVPGDLERYRSVRFEPATTTIGPKLCPPEVITAYDRAALQWCADMRDRFPGREPALRIATDVVYFQRKGLFGDAQLLARLKFTEAERPVGDALVVVGSKAFREGSGEALAETAIKTIGKYLRDGIVPEEEKEQKRERR